MYCPNVFKLVIVFKVALKVLFYATYQMFRMLIQRRRKMSCFGRSCRGLASHWEHMVLYGFSQVSVS